MHISVRRYTIHDDGQTDEMIQLVQEGFVPIISQTPGFVAYYAFVAGNKTVASVSVFESQAGAEDSVRLAAEWVGKNLAKYMAGPPQVTAGEVGAHATA